MAQLQSTFISESMFISSSGITDGVFGTLPVFDNSSINADLEAWNKFQKILYKGVEGSSLFTDTIASTYSLVYTLSSFAYLGGVLAPNGDIHFVPWSANRGQKVSQDGTVSTYSLVYTTTSAYFGAVLASNGDIHFVPFSAAVGQKISTNGIVSTYSLIYTTSNAYSGGVLAPNGDIYFVPRAAAVGQKIKTTSVFNFKKSICLSPYFNKL